MSNASGGKDPATGSLWSDRRHAHIAALLTALLHLLALLVAILAPTPVMTPPQGASSGSWVQVDFIGETRDADQAPPSPPSGAAATRDRDDARRTTETPPAASPVQSTPVPRADDPVPPDVADLPAQRPSEAPSEPASTRDSAPPRDTRRPAANPAATTRRRPEAWGQPPGLIVQELAPQQTGPTHGPARDQGRAADASSTEPSLELGGYHVYYDLRSERRLREWQAQGMTELFIPLPGTRLLMVCPLEVALRRDSGKCRPLDPDSPELSAIGDARDVISVMQVNRQGKLLWRGPGPYR